MYGTGWIAVGTVLGISAFVNADQIAFFVASFVAMLWGILNLAAWADTGGPRGYAGAVIWFALAGFILVLSGWREPPHRDADPEP